MKKQFVSDESSALLFTFVSATRQLLSRIGLAATEVAW